MNPRSVLLLAAGEGRRMRPLTAQLPKPLLPIGGRPLIEHHVRGLAAAGFSEIVVNLFHRGEQIAAHLGDGSGFGVVIRYSRETARLDTGGGVRQALALLDRARPFALVSADLWTDYPLARLRQHILGEGTLMHLVMVPPDPETKTGDYALVPGRDGPDTLVTPRRDGHDLVYGNLAVLDPRLFDDAPRGAFPLRERFDAAVSRGRASGERYAGEWVNVGTPAIYDALRQRLSE